MSIFFEAFTCDFNHEYSLVIEDNKKVAYAYLMRHGEIIGDVWLYNLVNAPPNDTWEDFEMPFLNPAKYINERGIIQPVKEKSEIKLTWGITDEKLIVVTVFIHGVVIAKLIEGAKPGWSKYVKISGPLALRWEE